MNRPPRQLRLVRAALQDGTAIKREDLERGLQARGLSMDQARRAVPRLLRRGDLDRAPNGSVKAPVALQLRGTGENPLSVPTRIVGPSTAVRRALQRASMALPREDVLHAAGAQGITRENAARALRQLVDRRQVRELSDGRLELVQDAPTRGRKDRNRARRYP